jgi:hypothetical protein
LLGLTSGFLHLTAVAVMQRHFQLSLIASTIGITATMLLSGASVHAGTPLSCMCDGKLKRVIA